MLPDPFPVARYRLEFETVRALHLPQYAGSALRGVFGHALKRLACVTRERDCTACSLYRSCPYTAVFDTPPPPDSKRTFSDIALPYIVEPPPWGAREHAPGAPLQFHLVLIGPALRHLPLVLMAWQRALAGGVGPGDGNARLVRVWAVGGPGSESVAVLAEPGASLAEHTAAVPMPPADAAPAEVTLEFTTPLRLKREGHAIGVARLGPQDLLMALVRRVADLAELQLGVRPGWDFAALKRAAGEVQGDKQLEWRDWTRYSQRQQRAMTFGGAVGRWRLRGDLRPFWPLLHLGQWLHVGGKATFGMGQYTLVETTPASS